MVAGYSFAFSLDTCFVPLVGMGYGLAFLLALFTDSFPLGMPNHIPYTHLWKYPYLWALG